jgi:branched-chain amino acid transport system substrate-binding protein
VTEQLTRRDALVAALAVTALGGQALARPRLARAAAVTNIGVILPLSKPADSVAGTNILNSARLWVEWVNSTGGVGGQHVAIKAYDSHAEPNRAVASLLRAVTKDGCVVILGGWDSPVATAEITAAHKQRVPMFVAYAWSQNITEANYPEVVRIGPNNDILSNAFAPFMQKRGYTQIGLLAEDTAFGQGEGGAIRATATLASIDVMAQTYKRETHDLRPVLRKILPAKPDALVLASSEAPALYLGVTQARAAGFKGDILLGWDYVDAAFWKAAGKRGVGVIWPTFSAPTGDYTAVGQTFTRLFKKKYKHAPLVYQAFTWDQLNAWKWVVETVGSPAPADVIPALPRIDIEGTLGRITLSNKPGTVHFNQWDGVTVYFDQATKKGAIDGTAKLVARIRGQTP